MFYLGTHEPSWLERTTHPLFVSRRRLARLKRKLPVRLKGGWHSPWAIDSGGFTELNLYGRWETTSQQYADECQRWSERIGAFDFAVIQDWMCEPFVLAKTGKTIAEHQRLSVESYLTLQSLAPSVPWAPVLQGWQPDDYLAHAEQYRSAGVDLHAVPVVGVGTICRRQGTKAAEDILLSLRPLNLKLHGFGLKIGFLKLIFDHGLESSDSMAWGIRARRSPPLPGHTHKSCANCIDFAMRWRHSVLRLEARPRQLVML